MAKYKVEYKNNPKSTSYIEADSTRSAYIKFLEESDLHQKPVLVFYKSAEGNGVKTQTFSEHIDEINKFESNLDSNASTVAKLEEIHSTLKAIRLIGLSIALMIASSTVWQCSTG